MLTKEELNSEAAKRIYKAIGKRYAKDFRLLSAVVRKKDYVKYDLRNSSFEKNNEEMTITENLRLKNSNKQVTSVARKSISDRTIDVSLFISKREGLGEKTVGIVDYWYADDIVIVTRTLDSEELKSMSKTQMPEKPQAPAKRRIRKIPMLFARNKA